MALTPEEQELLRRKKAELAALKEQEEGAAAIDKTTDAAEQPKRTRPFNLVRAIGGGLRDAAQGLLDLGEDLDRATGQGLIQFGSDASNGWVSYASREEVDKRGLVSTKLSNFEGSENAGGLEQAIRGITSFAVPFVGTFRAARGLQALGAAGNISRGVIAGAAADFSQIDPYEGNVINVMEQFGIKPDVLDSLVSEEDDSRLEARFKAAVGGGVVGLGMDALIGGGVQVLKGYRAIRGTREAAEAVVENVQRGPVKIDTDAARASVKVRGSTAQVAEGATDGTGRMITIPEAAANQAADVIEVLRKEAAAEVKTLDDAASWLEKKAGSLDLDDEAFEKFARELLDEDPENALVKMGIDPLNMDFEKLADPEMIGRFHARLSEVYGKVAARMGRTGKRISEASLLRSAQSLASTPEVLRQLYGATSKLDQTIMASRMFVGAHTHKLMTLTERAIAEIAAGNGTGPAWQEFLKAFHLQALFLGSLRGAGSEVGRALRSLRTQAKLSPKAAAKMMGEAVDNEAKDLADAGLDAFTNDADLFAKSLSTDAERLEALQKILTNKGDVEELSRSIRSGSVGIGKRVSQAVKETIGSLFSVSTATLNIAAGATFIGLNSIGRVAAALARSPMLLTKGPGRIEAERALLEAWAYNTALLGGVGEAFGNTIRVLQREVLSEGSLVANALGFEGLAAKALKASIATEKKITGRFERADVVSSKAFAVSASERRALEKAAEEMGGGKFWQLGMKGLIRMAATTVNTAGAAYRSGTTMFINLPDEFVGSLAKRAGAKAQAARIAAAEVHQYGLTGREATEYLLARTRTLFGDGPAGWSVDGITDGAQHAMARAGETEARAVLFQDQLEGQLNRSFSRWYQNNTGAIGTLIIPFIKTPLRIIERTARDFTVYGLARERVRNAILYGTPAERDEAIARMSMGMTALFTAYQLAEDRMMVGHDGGFTSTARDAGRPSYSVKIGDGVYEFGRLDPLGTLLGIGADMHEFLANSEDDPQAMSRAAEATEGFIWALTTNILSKSWLTSVKQLTDLAGATSDEDFTVRLEKAMASTATRFVPASGIQRTLNSWSDASIKEAAGFWEGVRRSSLGDGELADKRDFLGRTVERQVVSQAIGYQANVLPDPAEDPVMAEFEALSMREPTGAKTQRGVKLTSNQFSRYLQLRGQEVISPKTGMTMEAALKVVVTNPRYKAQPKAAREAILREVMQDYGKLAADTLTQEDNSFALAQLRNEVFELSGLNGWDETQREQMVDKTSELYLLKKGL